MRKWVGMGGAIVFSPRPDGFNINPLFAPSIISIIPSALLLTAAPWRLAQFYSKSATTRPGWLLRAKLTVFAILVTLQLALLGSWVASENRTRFNIPVSALGVAAIVIAAALSYLEHRRAIQPSALLGGYLWLSTLLSIPQAIALFSTSSASETVNSSLLIAIVPTRAILIVLEEWPKRKLLEENVGDWSAEETSGPLNRLTFWWLNGLFLKGYKTQLRVKDLGGNDDAFSSEKLLSRIEETLDKGDPNSKYYLVRATLSALKGPFLMPIVPRLLKSVFQFAQPILINRVIKFVSEPQGADSSSVATSLVVATAVVYIGIAICDPLYSHILNRFVTALRGSLSSLIFAKITKLDTITSSDLAAVTLMSTDIDGITGGIEDFHEIWANIIELCVAMYLLQREIGPAFFLAAVPALICITLTSKVSDGILPARMAWMQGVQTRVGETSSMLSQIKSLKMMGLTDYMGGYLRQLRIHELDLSKRFRNFIVVIITIANISDQATPAVVITAAVFWTRSGPGGFTVSQAFTCLSILNLISTPIAELTSVYPQIVASLGCFERIQTFLLSNERKDGRIVKKTTKNGHANGSNLAHSIHESSTGVHNTITFRNVSATLPGKTKPVLQNLTLDIKPSSFTIAIGPVGSGKSIFLKTILGEVPVTDGAMFLNCSQSSMAFCDQSPWLRNVSVRENILTGSPYDHEWYHSVIRDCALDRDIDNFPDRDHTIVGSGGITLSGGQKQRLALARAVYSRNEIILLDDVFSALDTTTSTAIFNNLLKLNGLLRSSNPTIVLTTHAVHYLPFADNIIVLDGEGRVRQNGTFADLQSKDGYVKDLAIKHRDDKTNESISTEDQKIEEEQPSQSSGPKDDPTERQFADWALYKFYLNSVPTPMILIFVFFAVGYILLGRMAPVWIKIWTDHGTDKDTGTYFGIYMALCVTTVILSACTPWWTMNILIPRSAIHLHQLLLDAYLQAPLYFLTSTDNGVILNRFSQDMTLVDQQMPMAFFETTLNVTVFLVTAGIIASGAKYLGVIMPISLLIVYIFQRFYIRTSQQMRHLELESKSPLYTHFTETLNGVPTIRAFGWEKHFLKENLGLLDFSQRPYYILLCIQQWLSLSMGMFVAAISVLLVGLAVNFTGTTTGSGIGLSMVSLMNFNGGLSFLVRSWTNMETSLGAAARIKGFVENTPSENRTSEKLQLPKEWPSKGAVEVAGITAAYKPSGNSVLRNISLSIKPGQKIGICGRTGSGKSSLILTLLRLLETTSGSIQIDGTDLATVLRQGIRSHLTVLPQDPVKLPGTVRDNLDPERHAQGIDTPSPDDYRDNQLKNTLQKVGIWTKVSEGGGLDAKFEDLGLSHGQHQLFALTRTFLRNSKVVLLDEATSSVDGKTDEEMQQVLNDVFERCTVVTVAHRLESIVNADVVVVMENGEIAEVGDPQELKNTQGSVFKGLWELRHG